MKACRGEHGIWHRRGRRGPPLHRGWRTPGKLHFGRGCSADATETSQTDGLEPGRAAEQKRDENSGRFAQGLRQNGEALFQVR